MNVFDYVTHSDIAENLAITKKACYKVKYNTPNRYKQAAIDILLEKITFPDLIKAINFILDLRNKPQIQKKR